MAKTNLGHGRCSWDAYEQVASASPPPPFQVEVEESDAQASEPPAVEHVMRAKIDPFAGVASSSQGYCPTPIVMAVHPELVSMAGSLLDVIEEGPQGTPIFLPNEEMSVGEEEEDDEVELPEIAKVAWVLPPCISDPARDYNDDLRRLQLKMRMPGSVWDVEALARMEAMESRPPLEVPYLTGTSTIRASAHADAPNVEAILAEEEQEADDLAIPSDPVLIDAYLVNSDRHCLSGPYREGTVWSQRNLFGGFLDRPAGMSEVMLGQTRSASVTRRKESMIPRGDSGVTLQTPSTEHFV